MSLVEMPLKFSVDPQTGVIVPPVTVFNGGSQVTTDQRGGKRSSLSGKRKSKSKTRKSKAKKTMKKRR